MKTQHEPPLEPQSPFLRTIRSSVCLLVSVLRSHPSRHQLHQAVVPFTRRDYPSHSHPPLQDAKPQAQASVQILLRIVDPRDPLRSPHQGQAPAGSSRAGLDPGASPALPLPFPAPPAARSSPGPLLCALSRLPVLVVALGVPDLP